MRRRRIVLIGYGAIAGDLAATLLAAREPGYDLAILLAEASPSRQRVPSGCALLSDMTGVAAFTPDLVVEAAGHGAIAAHGPACLGLGLPLLISSIGALHDAALLAALTEAARTGGGRLLLPSGALGALDYVRAVRGAADLSMRYESRKPPAAWKGELERLGHDPTSLDGPVTLFAGDARAAAAAYPQNLNVAAALALAGPGFSSVEVAVVCDPAAAGNTHIVEAKSALGTMRIEIANRPSPANPKTSWIVGASLMAAIEQYFSPIQML
jgi:aspartate dehydrogenase